MRQAKASTARVPRRGRKLRMARITLFGIYHYQSMRPFALGANRNRGAGWCSPVQVESGPNEPNQMLADRIPPNTRTLNRQDTNKAILGCYSDKWQPCALAR